MIYKYKEFILEYLSNDEIYLRDYFKQTKDQKKYNLPFEYYYLFYDFFNFLYGEFSLKRLKY